MILRLLSRFVLLAVPFLLFAAPASAFLYVGPNCQYHTIQAAINAAQPPFDNFIYVAPGTYNELLTINKSRLGIQGGATFDCNAGLAGNTIISGATHVGDSVVTISGQTSVDLHDLTISDGNENSDGGHGGGIDFGGHGQLDLYRVVLINNYAAYGGGLDVTPDGDTVVNIHEGTQIDGNTAGLDGGGILIDGRTRLYIDEPETLIFFNHAARNGGAIDVTGPARVDIGSPGFSGLPVIYLNDAQNGGGISALAHDEDREAAVVRLFTIDPDRPVAIKGNVASNLGGAVYLKPFSSVALASASAALCAYNFRLVGNFAAEGAAIYADNDSALLFGLMGADVYLNENGSAFDYVCNPEPVSDLGGVARCADGVPCNEIAGNSAEATVNGTIVPTDGATVLLRDAASLRANRFRLQGNYGGYAIRALGGGIAARNCLVADNQVSHELVRTEGQSESTVSNCTLAHDVIGAARVIHAQIELVLHDSIIAEDRPTIDAPPSAPPSDLQYILSNDLSTLTGCVGCLQGDPRFANVAAGDYHLQQTSPAVDFAPTNPDLDPDLDSRPREIELHGINSSTNPRDLGAYELQSADVIFNDGFQQVP